MTRSREPEVWADGPPSVGSPSDGRDVWALTQAPSGGQLGGVRVMRPLPVRSGAGFASVLASGRAGDDTTALTSSYRRPVGAGRAKNRRDRGAGGEAPSPRTRASRSRA